MSHLTKGGFQLTDHSARSPGIRLLPLPLISKPVLLNLAAVSVQSGLSLCSYFNTCSFKK